MTTELAQRAPDITAPDYEQAAGALEHILATGDLLELTPPQRIGHYLALCKSLGLNSLSRPFDWLTLDSRLVLYPNKSCGEQLRRLHQISVKLVRKEQVGDLFVVEVEGRAPNGRSDFASKYVPTTAWDARAQRQVRLAPPLLANAYAKAETGAKRRLIMSMVGLAGLPDTDELARARAVIVDATGNVIEEPSPEQRALASDPKMARVIGEPTFETVAGDDEQSPLTASQAPTADELEPPRRTVGRQSFRPDETEVKRRCGAWFAIVKGTSLDDDEARHRYIRQWTASRGWPKGRQTESLRVLAGRLTEDEAAQFFAEVRFLAENEKEVVLRSLEGSDDTLEPDDDDEQPF
jgi:hypothetical protein